jgi:hypothetical protein
MSMRTIIAFLFLVLAMLNLAPAQTEFTSEQTEPIQAPEQRAIPDRFVYEWTDDSGVVHMTDDPGKVPKKYRDKKLKKRTEPRREGEQETSQGEATEPAPGYMDQEYGQQQRSDEWRQRYLGWKDKLQQSEKQLQSLQQRRANLIMPWGSPAVAPPAVREEIIQLDKALQDTQAEIDEARHMLEDVLPDEARKAGVPPGLQRE